MKVCILSGDLKYIVTGSERYLYEMALYLEKNNVDTTLLIINDNRMVKRENPNYAKIARRYASIRSREVTPKIVDAGPLHISFFYFKNLPKDSIIYLPNNLYVHLLNVLTKPAGQKYIIGSHVLQFNSYYQSSKHTILERTFNKMIKNMLKLKSREFKHNLFFHVINLQQKSYLEKEFGIKPENILHVPIFARAEKFRIGNNNSKKLRVMHIGGTGKNAALVLKVIDELQRRKQMGRYEFHFIGKSEPKELNEMAKEHPNIINHGMADDEEKIKIHSESDVLIVPSVEAFPLTVLEGLAAGLTIISRNNSINKELNELGAELITVCEEPEAFADALEKVANAKIKGELTTARKKKYKALVLENFSYVTVMPQLLKMFELVDKS